MMSDSPNMQRLKLLDRGSLVLIVNDLTDHAALIEFMVPSEEQRGDLHFVFCQSAPMHLESTDYSSKRPPRAMLTGHFHQEKDIRGWRFPIKDTDKLFVGPSEVLKYLEQQQGMEPHAAALREVLYQIKKRAGSQVTGGYVEVRDDTQNPIYHCEICGINFKYSRGNIGVYQFSNCPESFMTGDPADLRCKKLNSRICPNL